MEKKRVAVIGAGASGLVAIKSCLDEGLEPVCFEKSTGIGGLWWYRENRDGQGCVFKSTVINTSKEHMAYSDFPAPKDFPNFMHNRYLRKYFHLYADHFGLEKYIKYQTYIKHVTHADDYDTTGQWRLELKSRENDSEWQENFDAVLVCSGHHVEPNIPDFPGLKDFKGNVVHTHDYKTTKGYEDSRTIVVGVGNSGGDAAVELSHVCSQVFQVTRTGTWVLTRVGPNGTPGDVAGIRRFTNLFPESFLNSAFQKQANQNFDHARYGLKPKHKPLQAHPTVNDALPNRILNGTIKIKCNIKKILPTSVEFEDGTVEENIDNIILATGYNFGFPMVDSSVIKVEKNQVSLYKYVFPPNLKHPTIAFIGLIQPWGAINPIAELQCRWATRVFRGATKLPSRDMMWEDIIRKKNDMKKRYVARQRHTIQVDWIPFMDEVASEFGAKPDLWNLFFKDPVLALRCFFGPCYPYQYRLMGPGMWQGAKEAISTAWDRIEAPTMTRKVPKGEASKVAAILKLLVFVAIFLGIILRFV
ncbi:flavin-containing monooxygenase 5-like [Amphiura filiformis]|uniref:flavin-containing monooxygenase 5-like n=1 Tax=Amphiura filiformis TaxID=82378 RepID=UPI003B215B70